MGNSIWLLIMIPCSLLFTGIAIYAFRAKKPMWFWSGTVVREEELTDVKAYNRENGFMWLGYSLIFWVCTFLGFWQMAAAGVVLVFGCVLGTPLLTAVYHRIYLKYKR